MQIKAHGFDLIAEYIWWLAFTIWFYLKKNKCCHHSNIKRWLHLIHKKMYAIFTLHNSSIGTSECSSQSSNSLSCEVNLEKRLKRKKLKYFQSFLGKYFIITNNENHSCTGWWSEVKFLTEMERNRFHLYQWENRSSAA